MDHVVHINNGSGAAKPIVLRLLPGEETIFNLKVVNHGEPSNISLQASSPVLKAVRLKKPDHYVVQEEIIPILARMPANKKRLDGEILLCGGGGESRVPITLLRDSEDPGDDLEDPGLQGDEELKDDEEEDEDEEDSQEIKRVKRSEDEDEEGDEEKEKEPRRIAFSRDRDLQRYRSATRQQRAGGIESSGEKRGLKLAGSRIDDRFVDPGNKQEEGPRIIPRQVPVHGPVQGEEERQRPPVSGYEDRSQDFRQGPDSESRETPTSAAEREQRAEERAPEPEEPEVYVEQDEAPESIYLDRLGTFGGMGALKVIPAALFLALVIVLVLTFITESIPEFPGALASSILIVTLIIHGAATLLKA